MRLRRHGKGTLSFIEYFVKIRASHNRVSILSSKHTYRPIKARVVSLLIYKSWCSMLSKKIMHSWGLQNNADGRREFSRPKKCIFFFGNHKNTIFYLLQNIARRTEIFKSEEGGDCTRDERTRAKPFLWKCVWFLMRINLQSNTFHMNGFARRRFDT